LVATEPFLFVRLLVKVGAAHHRQWQRFTFRWGTSGPAGQVTGGSPVRRRAVVGQLLCAATGHPVIEGSLAHLECQLAAEYDGGDHLIVTAHVLGLGHATREAARPLLYYRSRYHGLADHAHA